MDELVLNLNTEHRKIVTRERGNDASAIGENGKMRRQATPKDESRLTSNMGHPGRDISGGYMGSE